MKIPGLTFIFIPIVVWLIYAYSGYVFSSVETFFSDHTISEILFIILMINTAMFVLEIGIRMMFEIDGDIGEFFSFKPILLIWDILIYINEKLTIKI